MRVGLSTTAIFGDLSGYFFGCSGNVLMVVTVKSIGKIVMFLQGISGLWEWLLSIPISSHSHIVIPIHIPEIYAL